jgi:hypothetical protein
LKAAGAVINFFPDPAYLCYNEKTNSASVNAADARSFPPEATALDALDETGGPWPFDVTDPLQKIGAK